MMKSSCKTWARGAWLELMCVISALSHPCFGAQSDSLTHSSVPCTENSQRVTPDTHVFFSDENMELLALRLSSGLYADRQIYDRLVRDVKMIRARDHRVAAVAYSPRQNVRVLNVYFKPYDFWRVRISLYRDWNCLNSFLGAEVADHPEFEYAELRFRGLYNPETISKWYRDLPGVKLTEFSSMLGDSSNIYVSRQDSVWKYLFNIAGGDCLAGCTTADMHYFEVSPDGQVQRTATWNTASNEPTPDWATANFRKYR
jgi:hypothetical protein